MCVVSMVHDHYDPLIPRPGDINWPVYPSAIPAPQRDFADLLRTIDEFKKAREAAETVDKLTAQPDCVDPEKAKLLERVERLERIIDALLDERAKRAP